MAIKYIVLSMGYVESGSVTSLILENQTGIEFETAKEALRNLASGVFKKYWYEYHQDLEPTKHLYKQCCKKTVLDNTQAKFCMECGKSFKPVLIIKDQFISFLSGLCTATADDWGGDDIPGWWPWVSVTTVMKNATVAEVLEISESGAEVVTEFLSPDDVPEQFRSTIESWKTKHVRPNVQLVLKELNS